VSKGTCEKALKCKHSKGCSHAKSHKLWEACDRIKCTSAKQIVRCIPKAEVYIRRAMAMTDNTYALRELDEAIKELGGDIV